MANVKATDLIDFTRASKGHAMAKVSYGNELVVNGGFDTDSNWVKEESWTISGGTATYDGVIHIERLSQNFSITTGKLVKISYSVKNVEAGKTAYFNVAGSSTGSPLYKAYTNHTEGDYEIITIVEGGTLGLFFTALNTGTGGAFDLDNVSVKEVTFDQPDGTIQLFEHPNNIPRIEYDSAGNLLGLLIEESRTNTIQYSEDFENSYWGKGGGFSIYGNHGIAPDGTRTATLLTDINDEDSYIIEPNICSNGQTKSVWIRTVSGTATLNVLTHHDQLDGEVTVTEEWQRFERAVDISEPGGDDFFIFDTRSGTNTASDIYIWGAQLETGGFATSYIRSNSGSSTTRSSDIASMPIDFGYNLTEGTVTTTFQRMGIQSSGNDYVVQFFEASDQRTALYLTPTQDRTYSAQSTSQNNFDFGSPVTGQYTKIAYAFATNDFAASRDGGTVLTDTSGTFDGTGHATVHIGHNNGSEVFTGHLKSIQYTPKRLSNAKLQELSS